ncbi:Autism susceptibility 2 protein, partial [Stegodyphus mimosarum]
MCDSESGDERGSEPECDLFNSKITDSNFIAKKNNPGHSQNCRSPPVLPPIHPVQNGTHHPEPSTAVAAVTASASPSNTSSTMVVGAASPREPQIGSPAVIPVSCSSPASPPSGVVPASPPPPPFLHKGHTPAVNNKESASGSKLLSNGYEFVSDTSPPSPVTTTKLLSPSKFLHKRAPAVPSCRESVATLSKPAINVYDFVSDHSAPSSPDGVIFLSQSKFLHKGISPPVASVNKDSTADKMGVSNGHATNLCVSAPPVLSAPVIQNSHKSALDMSIKTGVSVCKTEQPPPPTILPPAMAGDLRLQSSPGQSRSSYGIPYSTSQPMRKLNAATDYSNSPRMSPLTIPASLSSPVISAPSILPVSPAAANSAASSSMRTSVSTSVTMSSATSSHVLASRSRSPTVTASHPNTPTPVPARDTHSSHSNSSLSSLSQLSTPVNKDREGGGSRSHSNSSNVVPSVSSALTSTSVYASASSLAGLVFSKPQCWSGSSSTTNTVSTSAPRSSPAPPQASPALSNSGSTSLPLPPTLPPAHHTSPFNNHPGPPPPPLLPVASHHTIFTPGSLTPTLPLESTAGPSPYRAETLFPQHSEYKKHPDLLRRELDTRFLASQDHSIPIPPPPYMQSEVQHHTQMHQQAPFIAPPPLGAPMVTQPASHLYEKYPKLDSSLYRRPSIGLSGYPTVSSLFAPGGGASTPFVPPAHLAALQPKINSVSKTKSMKPGKWCAMHVRIAWEIYNHQQKQKQAEAHKAGIALAAAVKPPADHLHATNHLFCSMPRQHELSPFSSSLLSAAASAHPRSFETSSHHSTFLNPTPAHLGPFARPGYPSFPGSAPGFAGLGPLGIPGPAMLSADLRTSCLTQDPWAQRTALPFAGGSPWGGLKEEAERDRLQQERKREEERQKRAEQERREKEERERREQERREQERRELERQEQERKEQERKEKERREQERRRELERREMERREQERREQERREQERQKDRDRELRLHHQLQKSSIIMNGEIRDHHLHHTQHHHPHHAVAREWERTRDSRELPRSPVVPSNNPVKYEGALERHYAPPPPRMEVKIKQERKDDEPVPVSRSSRSSIPGDERIRKRPGSIPQSETSDPVSLVSSRSVIHNSVALGLNSIDHSRVMGPHGLVPSPAKETLAHHSQTSPLWGPLTPSPTVTTIPGSAIEHYRTREMLQGRPEHDVRRYDSFPQRDTCAGSELSRQISNALELERAAVAAAYDRSKLLPPPLRTNESHFTTPPTLPPASASSFFSPPVSPYLSSLCSTSGRTKPGPPSMLNGLPPPLIPCTFPMQNHTGFPTTRTSSPMAPHKLIPGAAVLNLQESYFPKDRREVNGHPSDFDAHLRL